MERSRQPVPAPTPPLFVTGLVGGDTNTSAAANLHVLQAAAEQAERSHGGRVTLPPGGPYRISGTVLLGSRVVLDLNCQTLKLANGASTTTAPKSVVAAKPATNYVGVVNGIIDGNKANQPDTSYGSHGVDYSRQGTEGGGTTWDGGLFVDGLVVQNCKGTGLLGTGDATTLRATNSTFLHNDGYGIFAKTDCGIANCVAGNNGGIGLRVYAGTSVRVASFKAFGSCIGGPGPEILIHYCESVRLANVEAEDFGQVGVQLTAVKYLTAFGLGIYRGTGRNADGYSSALWVEDDGAGNQPSHLTISGVARCDGGPTPACYALTTRNLGPQCEINLKADGWSTAARHNLSGDGTGLSDSRIQIGTAL